MNYNHYTILYLTYYIIYYYLYYYLYIIMRYWIFNKIFYCNPNSNIYYYLDLLCKFILYYNLKNIHQSLYYFHHRIFNFMNLLCHHHNMGYISKLMKNQHCFLGISSDLVFNMNLNIHLRLLNFHCHIFSQFMVGKYCHHNSIYRLMVLHCRYKMGQFYNLSNRLHLYYSHHHNSIFLPQVTHLHKLECKLEFVLFRCFLCIFLLLHNNFGRK